MTIQHQDIETRSNQSHTLRQTRFNDLNYLDLIIGDQKVSLLNYSAYGFAYSSEENHLVGSSISECKLFAFSKLIGEFDCVVRRSQKNLNNQYELGLEIIDGELDINAIQTLSDIHSKVSAIYEKENRYKLVPTEVVTFVQTLAAKLQAFESVAKSIEAVQYGTKHIKNSNFQLTMENLGSHIYKELSQINLKIQGYFHDLDDQQKKICLDYYRELIGPYVLQSNFTNRSFTKPLGYAGDYEMMNQLYRNDNFSPTLFGSCVEFAVNLHDEPSAVRNRAEFLSNKILDTVSKNPNKKIRVLAVACGPAEEIKLTIQKLTQEQLKNIEVHLLDQDQQALLYAQQNIKSQMIESEKQLDVKLVNKSIKEIIMSGLASEYNLIYSAGLFDYFTDAVARRASRSLSKVLANGGQLVIGNFNISSPNWFGMLALFDWQLILRSEEDLRRIFSADGFQVSIEKEPRNVNLFCIIRKNE